MSDEMSDLTRRRQDAIDGFIMVILVFTIFILFALLMGAREDARDYCEQLGGVYDGANCLTVSPR